MNRSWKKKNGAKIRLAASRAKLIRNALRQIADTNAIVEDFLTMYYGTTITPEEARAWAAIHIRLNTDALRNALITCYIDAYALGQDIGMNSIAKAKINKAPSKKDLQRAIAIAWENWKPGNKPAALKANPPMGLSSLLDSKNIVIQGVSKTSLDRIGTILATALTSGAKPSSVAGQVAEEIRQSRKELADEMRDELDDLLDDPSRALTIAQTEMTRAVTAASRELYQESGVELVEWLVAEPCDVCQENAEASPIRIDSVFPSGDTEPPAHPNCVCDLAPYVVDTRDIGQDFLAEILGE